MDLIQASVVNNRKSSGKGEGVISGNQRNGRSRKDVYYFKPNQINIIEYEEAKRASY